MTIEAELRSYLAGVVGVTSLVSTRIYQLIAPQHPTYPLIRLQEVDEFELYHLTAQTGLRRARIQFDSYVDARTSDPYTSVTDIGDAIHAALNATLISTLGSSPAFRVRGIFLQDRSTLYEAEELRLVRERRDYAVQYAPV